MTYSCADFTSDILQIMGDAGLLRQEDCPADDPQRQAGLACDVLRRLIEVTSDASALSAAIQSGSPREHTLAAAGALATRIARIKPRWMSSDNYEHCFVGAKPELTRWLVDLETGRITVAQVKHPRGWETLGRDQVVDLHGDLKDNDVRTKPEDLGAEFRDTPPAWAVPLLQVEAA